MATQLHAQVSIWDGTEWQDLGDYVSRIDVELGDVSAAGSGQSGADGVTRTLDVTILNEGIVEAGAFNAYPVTTEAFKARNRIMVDVQFTEPGEPPALEPEAWTHIFDGYLGDRIEIDGYTIELHCRDKGMILQDYFVDDVVIFPLEGGSLSPTIINIDGENREMYAAHMVIQQILDYYSSDIGNIELYTPDIPEDPQEWSLDPHSGQYIPAIEDVPDDPWGLEYQSIWDGLQEIARPFGWYLGYLKDENGEFRLTFMEPPIDKTDPDILIDWDEDIKVHSRNTSIEDVRNAITIVYGPPPEDDDEERSRITVTDATSISLYGRRAMMIEEGDTNFIRSPIVATQWAQKMLHDLKHMTATHQVDCFFLPEIDLFDLMRITNPLIDSSDFDIAVDSIKHMLSFGETPRFETQIIGTNQVVGGRRRWLEVDARLGIKSPIDEKDLATNKPVFEPQNLEVEALPGGLGVSFDRPATRRWLTTEYYIFESESAPTGFFDYELKLVTRSNSVEFYRGLSVGETYWIAVRNVDTSGARSELVEYPTGITVLEDITDVPPPEQVQWDPSRIRWGADYILLAWHPHPDPGFNQYIINRTGIFD